MNRDLVINADHKAVSRGAMSLLDRLQHLPKGEQPGAVSAIFLLLCEEWGLDPRDMLETAARLMRHADHTQRPEFKAVAMYIREELV